MSERGLTTRRSSQATKYSSFNANSVFKPPNQARQQKPPSINRGGLQSLGKTTVRPPKPVAIPSLRKEHAGHDPTISLVPSGGGGWGTANSSKEKTRSSSPALERPKAEPVASTTSSATSSNQSLNDTPAKRNWAAVSSPEPAGAKKGPAVYGQHAFQKEFPSLGDRATARASAPDKLEDGGAGESYRTSFRPGDVPAGAASSSVSASAARPRVLGHRSNAIGRGGLVADMADQRQSAGGMIQRAKSDGPPMQRPIVNPSSDMRGAREMDDEASWAAHQEEVDFDAKLCWSDSEDEQPGGDSRRSRASSSPGQHHLQQQQQQQPQQQLALQQQQQQQQASSATSAGGAPPRGVNGQFDNSWSARQGQRLGASAAARLDGKEHQQGAKLEKNRSEHTDAVRLAVQRRQQAEKEEELARRERTQAKLRAIEERRRQSGADVSSPSGAENEEELARHERAQGKLRLLDDRRRQGADEMSSAGAMQWSSSSSVVDDEARNQRSSVSSVGLASSQGGKVSSDRNSDQSLADSPATRRQGSQPVQPTRMLRGNIRLRPMNEDRPTTTSTAATTAVSKNVTLQSSSAEVSATSSDALSHGVGVSQSSASMVTVAAPSATAPQPPLTIMQRQPAAAVTSEAAPSTATTATSSSRSSVTDQAAMPQQQEAAVVQSRPQVSTAPVAHSVVHAAPLPAMSAWGNVRKSPEAKSPVPVQDQSRLAVEEWPTAEQSKDMKDTPAEEQPENSTQRHPYTNEPYDDRMRHSDDVRRSQPNDEEAYNRYGRHASGDARAPPPSSRRLYRGYDDEYGNFDRSGGGRSRGRGGGNGNHDDESGGRRFHDRQHDYNYPIPSQQHSEYPSRRPDDERRPGRGRGDEFGRRPGRGGRGRQRGSFEEEYGPRRHDREHDRDRRRDTGDRYRERESSRPSERDGDSEHAPRRDFDRSHHAELDQTAAGEMDHQERQHPADHRQEDRPSRPDDDRRPARYSDRRGDRSDGRPPRGRGRSAGDGPTTRHPRGPGRSYEPGISPPTKRGLERGQPDTAQEAAPIKVEKRDSTSKSPEDSTEDDRKAARERAISRRREQRAKEDTSRDPADRRDGGNRRRDRSPSARKMSVDSNASGGDGSTSRPQRSSHDTRESRRQANDRSNTSDQQQQQHRSVRDRDSRDRQSRRSSDRTKPSGTASQPSGTATNSAEQAQASEATPMVARLGRGRGKVPGNSRPIRETGSDPNQTPSAQRDAQIRTSRGRGQDSQTRSRDSATRPPADVSAATTVRGGKVRSYSTQRPALLPLPAGIKPTSSADSDKPVDGKAPQRRGVRKAMRGIGRTGMAGTPPSSNAKSPAQETKSSSPEGSAKPQRPSSPSVKRNVMHEIDLTSATVCVIDEQPEKTKVRQSSMSESGGAADGFQEVVSRRKEREKQKQRKEREKQKQAEEGTSTKDSSRHHRRDNQNNSDKAASTFGVSSAATTAASTAQQSSRAVGSRAAAPAAVYTGEHTSLSYAKTARGAVTATTTEQGEKGGSTSSSGGTWPRSSDSATPPSAGEGQAATPGTPEGGEAPSHYLHSPFDMPIIYNRGGKANTNTSVKAASGQAATTQEVLHAAAPTDKGAVGDKKPTSSEKSSGPLASASATTAMKTSTRGRGRGGSRNRDANRPGADASLTSSGTKTGDRRPGSKPSSSVSTTTTATAADSSNKNKRPEKRPKKLQSRRKPKAADGENEEDHDDVTPSGDTPRSAGLARSASETPATAAAVTSSSSTVATDLASSAAQTSLEAQREQGTETTAVSSEAAKASPIQQSAPTTGEENSSASLTGVPAAGSIAPATSNVPTGAGGNGSYLWQPVHVPIKTTEQLEQKTQQAAYNAWHADSSSAAGVDAGAAHTAMDNKLPMRSATDDDKLTGPPTNLMTAIGARTTQGPLFGKFGVSTYGPFAHQGQRQFQAPQQAQLIPGSYVMSGPRPQPHSQIGQATAPPSSMAARQFAAEPPGINSVFGSSHFQMTNKAKIMMAPHSNPNQGALPRQPAMLFNTPLGTGQPNSANTMVAQHHVQPSVMMSHGPMSGNPATTNVASQAFRANVPWYGSQQQQQHQQQQQALRTMDVHLGGMPSGAPVSSIGASAASPALKQDPQASTPPTSSSLAKHVEAKEFKPNMPMRVSSDGVSGQVSVTQGSVASGPIGMPSQNSRFPLLPSAQQEGSAMPQFQPGPQQQQQANVGPFFAQNHMGLHGPTQTFSSMPGQVVRSNLPQANPAQAVALASRPVQQAMPSTLHAQPATMMRPPLHSQAYGLGQQNLNNAAAAMHHGNLPQRVPAGPPAGSNMMPSAGVPSRVPGTGMARPTMPRPFMPPVRPLTGAPHRVPVAQHHPLPGQQQQQQQSAGLPENRMANERARERAQALRDTQSHMQRTSEREQEARQRQLQQQQQMGETTPAAPVVASPAVQSAQSIATSAAIEQHAMPAGAPQ